MDLDYDGPEHTVGVNPQYLVDALTTAPDGKPVQLGFGAARSPLTLRSDADPTWRHILMPIRIQN